MHSKRTVVFVGGGTGGHLQPLLVVIRAVEELATEHGIEVQGTYVGTERDVATPAVAQLPPWCGKKTIPAGKLHRFLTLDQVRQAARFGRGLFEASRIIREVRPDVVFAKGGYVSVPVAWAAGRKGIPVYCHESDSVIGLANRWATKYATTVYTAYPTKYYANVPEERLDYSGQPVRPEFFTASRGQLSLQGRQVDPAWPLLTVIGGSQGAKRLNELIRPNYGELLSFTQVVHLTGPKDLERMTNGTEGLSDDERSRLWVLPYVQEELPVLFKRSDLIVSRAGGTIGELAAVGAAALLVPLSTAAQDHQRKNAEILAAEGAARVFDEVDGTAPDLLEAIRGLFEDPDERRRMSEAIRAYSKPGAARRIAATILGIEE